MKTIETSRLITLKFPVTIPGAETIAALTMRRPQALDVVASSEAAADTLGQNIQLYGNLCMVTPDAIEELDAADFRALDTAFDELSQFEPVKDYSPGALIPLNVPIVGADGKPLESIAIRRPKTKDLRAAQSVNGAARQDCLLYATLSGLTPEQIYSLDWSDMRKVKDVYESFLD